jgi:DNA invertase Pin-like site-specific DNA recombinase
MRVRRADVCQLWLKRLSKLILDSNLSKGVGSIEFREIVIMLIGYAQRDALTEAGCEHIYTEQISGAVADRPELTAALHFARKGDTLVVWKLDRLAGSVKQLIETVEKLRSRGIGFRSLTEAIDTTTAQGRLIFHMFSALAEFERSLIRERTQAGLAAARRIGRTGGRPPKLTADDIEAAKTMLTNPDIGVTQIAHRLGVSPSTLYRYIPAARASSADDKPQWRVQFGRKIMKQSAQHTPTINVPFPEELIGSSCRAPQPGSARGALEYRCEYASEQRSHRHHATGF